MTDRIHALTVCLEKGIREDDVAPLISAISMLRGVLRVETHVSDLSVWAAECRVRHDLEGKILAIVEGNGK